MSAALSGDDVRHRWPTNDEINRVTIPAAEAWLRDALTECAAAPLHSSRP